MAARLEGFDEFEAALARLPKATGKNVLRRLARGALQPMADQARAKVPTKEGNLRENIAVSERRTRRVNRTGRYDRRNGVEMAMGPAGGTGALSYASHVEFGTVDTRPQPYMRPAWDGGSGNALDYIKDNMWDEINKAALRVQRKGAKLMAAEE